MQLGKLATSVLLLAGLAPAQLLIGAESNGSIWLVEPRSGQRHPAGNISAVTGVVGELAHDFTSGTVYVSSTSLHELYTCDLVTGTATRIGPYGGTIRYLHGLEWDSITGTLWGVPYSDGNLYSIDTNTGAATLVGSTGLMGFVNLAYDLPRDILYAVNTTSPGLYTIDRTTGAATPIGPLNGPQSPASLTYDLVTDTLFLADNQQSNLYVVDRTTGAPTLIGSLGSG
ncbi:MAG: hypothetical protein KDC98_22345, partial [Planctomycetes bacterium]|nr:hypothetical protein [Planctomycetota bacterium]